MKLPKKQTEYKQLPIKLNERELREFKSLGMGNKEFYNRAVYELKKQQDQKKTPEFTVYENKFREAKLNREDYAKKVEIEKQESCRQLYNLYSLSFDDIDEFKRFIRDIYESFNSYCKHALNKTIDRSTITDVETYLSKKKNMQISPVTDLIDRWKMFKVDNVKEVIYQWLCFIVNYYVNNFDPLKVLFEDLENGIN